jgi:hypothetical protein
MALDCSHDSIAVVGIRDGSWSTLGKRDQRQQGEPPRPVAQHTQHGSLAGVTQRGIVIALLVGAWSPEALAQQAPPEVRPLPHDDWKLAPVVEGRLRAEYRHEVGRDSTALVERARLGVETERGALEARVVLQETGVLGAGKDLTGGPLRFADAQAYELWGQWRPASAPMFVRVGRQPVAWGEGRLLGYDDWSPRGRVLDALRWWIGGGGVAFELLAAPLTNANVPAIEPYGELFGVRAEATCDRALAFELYALARLAQDNPVPSLNGTARGSTYTAALRGHGQTRAMRWGVEVAYQGGHVDELGKDRRAWAAASHLGYLLRGVALGPALSVGVAYASGDRAGRIYHGFDPLLPDEHRWHGAMDRFAWSNEAEASAGLSVVPWEGAEARGEYRFARLAVPTGPWLAADLTSIGAAPGNQHSDLGHEIDLVLTWQTDPSFELSAGYSALVLGSGARAIVRDNQLGLLDVSHFIYLQGTLILR